MDSFTRSLYNGDALKITPSVSSKSEDCRNIIVREHINKDKLKYSVENPDECNFGIRNIKGTNADKAARITLLQDYIIRTNNRGECEMGYHQRNGNGRYWSSQSLGLQNMSRKIRHTLCKERMIDIDMKHAHPTLLSWYCHNNNINCAMLDYYNNNRDRLLIALKINYGLDRDKAKKIFLAIINGKRILERDRKKYPKLVLYYYDNMDKIIDKVNDLNPELVKLATESCMRKGKMYNIRGSAINHLMCKFTNAWMQH